MLKVVSLVPSGTDILTFLGIEPEGVSHSCSIKGKPILTKSIIPEGLTQQEIDELVRSALAKGESLYKVDSSKLMEISPDVIVTQDVCDVCAVSHREVEQVVSFSVKKPKIVYLKGRRLRELFGDIQIVAEALNVDLKEKLSELEDKLMSLKASSTSKRVLFLEWLSPPFVACNWIPDIISWVGGLPVKGISGYPSYTTSWEELESLQVDVVVIGCCGYNVERTLEEYKRMSHRFAGKEVWIVDGNFFDRLSPRLIEGMRILRDILHGTGSSDKALRVS